MLSKKLLSALAAVAICSGACSSGDPAGSEPTASAESRQVATLTCTPLFATQAALLNCGASVSTQLATASSIQSTIAAQMQAAFATLTLTPNFAANQVVITSNAAAFSTFFGPQIIAPLTTAGAFTAAVPFTVGTIAPGLNLVANVFGTVPGLFTPFATGAPLFSTPFITGTAATNASLAAFNNATLNAAQVNSAALNTAAVNAAMMPLTFLISTPTIVAAPLICSGSIPLGCI
jgi:hypothetical protein